MLLRIIHSIWWSYLLIFFNWYAFFESQDICWRHRRRWNWSLKFAFDYWVPKTLIMLQLVLGRITRWLVYCYRNIRNFSILWVHEGSILSHTIIPLKLWTNSIPWNNGKLFPAQTSILRVNTFRRHTSPMINLGHPPIRSINYIIIKPFFLTLIIVTKHRCFFNS